MLTLLEFGAANEALIRRWQVARSRPVKRHFDIKARALSRPRYCLRRVKPSRQRSVSIPRARQRSRKAAGVFAAFSADNDELGMVTLEAAKIAIALAIRTAVSFRHK